MKTLTLLLFLPLLTAPGLRAGESCAKTGGKTSEACGAPAKKVTPFMAELTNAGTKTALKPATGGGAALKQGPAPKPGETGKTAPKTPQNTAGREGGPAAPAPEAPNTLSNPAWLLAAAALLIGLYYFLRETKKKR